MTAENLTCRELVELVTAYLEGSMTGPDRHRFEAHLAECSRCTTYVQQLRQMVRLAGHLREGDLSDEARETLLHVFQEWRRP